ncbi:trophoblast Kunitz domain protein 1-like isoform X1 [Ovis aries]|uniref:trophoblast Kunitz domain protein 1-like isoform X1 n=1 Tax=Ovis aries TaxID=9940 RepID=UPI001C2E9C0C|nr:trophoblast Kunitz domain protein 1-like isoform X1 [Ovis aries]XP_060253044.1 trophoblast Kunitz domain protein 1-like isoform X1 [Ovis aries]
MSPDYGRNSKIYWTLIESMDSLRENLTPALQALLFLLVILVDGTPVYEHHSLDQGLETSLTRGPEKLVVSSVIKEIVDDVIIGTKIICKACKMIRKVAETFKKCLEGEELISLRQLENHTLQEFPTYIFKEENKADSQPAFCLEPKLAGSCKNKTARYFYNAKTGCCEPFVYSGCEGNKNNFNTIGDCLKSCCPDCMKTCCTLKESQGGHVKSGP